MNYAPLSAEAQQSERLSKQALHFQAITHALSTVLLPRPNPMKPEQIDDMLRAQAEIRFEDAQSFVIGMNSLGGHIDHTQKVITSFARTDARMDDGSPASHFNQLFEPFAQTHGYTFKDLSDNSRGSHGDTNHSGMRKLVIEFLEKAELTERLRDIIEKKSYPVAGPLRRNFTDVSNPLDISARLQAHIDWRNVLPKLQHEIDALLMER